MARLKITKTSVSGAPVPEKSDAYHWDPELKGFGLRVTPKGVRSYVVQYRLSGRPARRITIGKHGSPWTPEKARRYAEDILYEVHKGIDPVVAAKKRVREAVELEFASYADIFVDRYLKIEWPNSWQDGKSQLDLHVKPKLKGRPLPQIERHEITALIDAISEKKATARNTHAVIRKLFNWAVDRGDIAHSPVGSPPPAVKKRKRILDNVELVALWRVTYLIGAPWDRYLRLLILTLQRREEVAGIARAELKHNQQHWHIPGQRTKNGIDHIVPLSAGARAEFDALGWKGDSLVFSTTGVTPISGFSKMKNRLDELMLAELQKMADTNADASGVPGAVAALPGWRLHDIRRTGTTAMQSLKVAIEATEKVINHISGETDGIRGVYNLYQYEPEKREALTLWHEHIRQLVANAERRATA